MPELDETEIAARLAARLCHDLVGPAGGVVSGLDLLASAPSGEIRAAARELVDSGARRLLALVVFARAAYGWDEQDFDAVALEALAQGLFRDQRPTLDWSVEAPSLPGVAARALLILVQIAGEVLAAGGRARIRAKMDPEGVDLEVEAVGPRARLHPDVAGGLRGEQRGDGLSARWIQGYFLNAMVAKAHGKITIERADVNMAFRVRLP